MMKKNFVLLAALIGLCCANGVWADSAEDHMKEFEGYAKQCKEELGVAEEDFEKLKANKFDPASTSDNMKCAIHCVLGKAGAMDAAGNFDPAPLKAKVPEAEREMAGKVFEKCSANKGSSPCDTAFLIMQCLMLEHLNPE